MWKSDKNNINIGPDVRLKKPWCFHFFRKFVPVPPNGSHIIMKNHSEFRLFFPMAVEIREFMVRYCTDLIIFGTCEEKMFFTRALPIFKTYPCNVQHKFCESILFRRHHIIMKNHSEFRLFFPMADEIREFPYHNKQ
jgi:hypothetical protein